MVFKVNNQITITKVDKVKKNLYIKVSYAEVIDYTTKANKEVLANCHYFHLNDDYVLDLQLYGKKIAKVVKEVEEGIDL